MAKATYIAHADTWLSHENRKVRAGDQFETEFPEGMRLGPNLQLVEIKPDGSPAAKPAGKKATQATDPIA